MIFVFSVIRTNTSSVCLFKGKLKKVAMIEDSVHKIRQIKLTACRRHVALVKVVYCFTSPGYLSDLTMTQFVKFHAYPQPL